MNQMFPIILIVLGIFAVPAVAQQTSTAPAQGVTEARLPLAAGAVLKKGAKLVSPSGDHYLLYQAGDGNLQVFTKDGQYVWGLDQVIQDFNGAAPVQVEFKADGRLRAYNDKRGELWVAPAKAPGRAASLNVTSDGDLQLVAANQEILWAHNGVLTPRIKVFAAGNRPNVRPGKPDPGWHRCPELVDPKIKINGSIGVSDSAMNAVANVYTEMMNRLKPSSAVPNPKRRFDGFIVYITNEEPWEYQKKLPVIGTMWPEQPVQKSGRWLQGGASGAFLWISEQMLAKNGVKIRLTTGIDDPPHYRSFDQVVHEMAHSINFKLVPDAVVSQFDGNINAVESFAFRVQQWFGVPSRKIPAKQEEILQTVFTSRALFSVEGYKLVPAEARVVAKGLPVKSGEVLNKGTKLSSRSGKHVLEVGRDGNLVVRPVGGGYVWGLDKEIANLPQARLDRVEFRSDGTLGAYDDTSNRRWSASGKSDPKATLNVTDGGVLQIIAPGGAILWASNGVIGAAK